MISFPTGTHFLWILLVKIHQSEAKLFSRIIIQMITSGLRPPIFSQTHIQKMIFQSRREIFLPIIIPKTIYYSRLAMTIFSSNIPQRIIYSRLGIFSRTIITQRRMSLWMFLIHGALQPTQKTLLSAPIPNSVKTQKNRANQGISPWKDLSLIPRWTHLRGWGKRRPRMAPQSGLVFAHGRNLKPVVCGTLFLLSASVGSRSMLEHISTEKECVSMRWIFSAASPSPTITTRSTEAWEPIARICGGSKILRENRIHLKIHPRAHLK